eukprot:2583965-Amphidinium_carterae.1
MQLGIFILDDFLVHLANVLGDVFWPVQGHVHVACCSLCATNKSGALRTSSVFAKKTKLRAKSFPLHHKSGSSYHIHCSGRVSGIWQILEYFSFWLRANVGNALSLSMKNRCQL